jgi:hypothetical protein
MPKYKVSVCRISYSEKAILVEAANEEATYKEAERVAGDLPFPNAHTANYEAQGAIEIP